ncbi:MAG: DUF2971 domain-containing protein [Lachnospiraceae bacterium]|nr:DUF2971 domain-containing protein [Lachnospiraceae bacterium]
MNNETYGISYEEYVEDYLSSPKKEFIGEGKYYHYTSLENCLNLLNHDNNIFELWASHLSYLNDKEEHVNGLKLIDRKVEDLLLSKGDDLSDWIEEYKEKQNTMLNEIFILCFCSKRSLLSQWKYYGKNSGIAIQYNLDHCEYTGYIEDGGAYAKEMFIPNFAQKVIYDNMEKQRIIDSFIHENIYSIYNGPDDKVSKYRRIIRNMDILYSLAPLFKHDAFAEENESRLLFRPLYLEDTVGVKDARDLVNYRVSNNKVIPYLKVKVRGKEEKGKRSPVILSLTVGPGENQDLIFDALKHFVRNKFPNSENHFEPIYRKDYSYIKVNGIEIRKASIPFRD